ncbi:hypothetical protein RvY_06159 [Ramazzottius varieornatus]|uniref:Uncharacterized protein n=1 Tax=Ramazzottius varieornatus TaxID=947166 RepID=A0A1D1V3Z9_RAMVA|nr:hypothetical protein RvY_06159 [Ramazzottius varieornatus]
MSKDLTTRHILIDISNGLDYTLKDEIFDRQFTQKFLRAYDKHHIVRTLLHQQGSAIGNAEELIQKLKTVSAPPKASILKYPGKFQRRNHPDISEELKRFFRQFVSNEELGPLEDINSFFAHCFVLLSPASKNLRKTFHDSEEQLQKFNWHRFRWRRHAVTSRMDSAGPYKGTKNQSLKVHEEKGTTSDGRAPDPVEKDYTWQTEQYEDPVGLKNVRDFTADEGTVEGVIQSGMSRMTSGTQLTRQAVAP